ncbi:MULTISPECIES: hypothetical protein [Variovorax]|uniref:hypothetical protein n=1 Tax=Variovorax TaxID=34072 RepID=UPI002858B029|nr:hypothetical protein [Variovorax sp. 3319]MDR6886095.1 hypothetical protein [Variovorax sp. 3319]
MKSILNSMLAGLVLAILAAGAHATQPGNNGGGNGGCGVGQQTNGCGGTTPTPAPVYNGGAGGAGGQGGTGVGVGVGIAGAAAASSSTSGAAAAVIGSGNSSSSSGAAVVGSGNSTNSIRNTNNNTNVQGQQQGQSQSSRNTNTAAGGAGGQATAAGGNSGGNTLSGGAVTVTVEGAKGDTYIAPAQERNPVATAYAAPVIASNGTCMGSSSGGGQGAAIGISFATTWTDSSCDIRYDAEALRAAGLQLAARARLCQKADIAKAMEAAGTPCPSAGAKRAAAILNGEPDPIAQRIQPMPWQAGG